MLRRDKPLLAALWVSSLFWLLAGMVPSAINTLGKAQFRIEDKYTSMLTGVVSIGIATGCVVGGLVSGGKVDFRLLRIGAFGMMGCLALMAAPGGGSVEDLMGEDGVLTRLPGFGETTQLLGYAGSMVTLYALGIFTGMFAIPLQVFMQTRPPDDKKGRMIAVMNQANWVGIAISGLLYTTFGKVIRLFNWQQGAMFLMIASLVLPIALFYRPRDESSEMAGEIGVRA